MAHAATPTLEHDKIQLGSVSARIGIPALLVGLAALGSALYLGLRDQATEAATYAMRSHFFHSYLAAYSFFLAITLGCMLIVFIHHATRAGWSVTVRRLAEGLSLNVFLMFILLLPMFIPIDKTSGVFYLLSWLRHSDPIIQAKSGYMNSTFFFIRILLYFAIWGFFAWFYASQSAKQDHTANPKISSTLRLVSYPAIILTGYGLTSYAFDWIMALNAHWFSTMFGVYFFAGCMLSAFSAITLLALALQKRGLVKHAITHEHYHDLGKWMFAFTFFWGYIAFSQYMLIWYSNLPEETQFFIPRQIGVWASISLCLLAVHLLIPFPGLLSRHMKRSNALVAFWAIWSMLGCALDLYWCIVPSQWIKQIPTTVGNPDMPLQNALPLLLNSTHDIYHLAPEHQSFATQVNFPLQPNTILITILCFIGIGGIYIFSTMLTLRGKPLVPTHDPKLTESLAFENI